MRLAFLIPPMMLLTACGAEEKKAGSAILDVGDEGPQLVGVVGRQVGRCVSAVVRRDDSIPTLSEDRTEVPPSYFGRPASKRSDV